MEPECRRWRITREEGFFAAVGFCLNNNAMQMPFAALLIGLALLTSGCMPTRLSLPMLSTSDVLAMSTTRALVSRGCYVCLRDALMSVGPLVGRVPDAARLAFETALLLTLREKELGLPATEFEDIARHAG